MKFKNIYMLTNGSGVSSKRVNGTLGMVALFFCVVYSAISKGLGEYHLLYGDFVGFTWIG